MATIYYTGCTLDGFIATDDHSLDWLISRNIDSDGPMGYPGFRERLKRKLAERLGHPRVEAARLSGERDRYEIKLKSPGIRLVYQVVDRELIVFVLAVDKRERSTVYEKASGRFYQRD